MGFKSRFIINGFISSNLLSDKIRREFLNRFGCRIKKSSSIRQNYYLESSNITVGENSFINYGFCYFDGGRNTNLTIGNGVMIGPKCQVIASSHPILKRDYGRAGTGFSKKIVIEDGCWIGANVTILPGVTVAKGCVIGASATVTKSTEPNGLYVGIPAKRIRDLVVND